MLVEDKLVWNRIVQRGEGFIFNDFGTQFPGDAPTFNTRDNNKLHRADCSQVKRMTHITDGKLTKHFFRSRQEAIEWLKKHRKVQGFTFCTYCSP